MPLVQSKYGRPSSLDIGQVFYTGVENKAKREPFDDLNTVEEAFWNVFGSPNNSSTIN